MTLQQRLLALAVFVLTFAGLQGSSVVRHDQAQAHAVALDAALTQAVEKTQAGIQRRTVLAGIVEYKCETDVQQLDYNQRQLLDMTEVYRVRWAQEHAKFLVDTRYTELVLGDATVACYRGSVRGLDRST